MKKIFLLGIVILLLCLTSCEENKEETPCEHVYQTEQIAPTCQEKGYMSHTCIFCGYACQSDFVSPIPHSFSSWTESVEASCDTKGIRKRTCTYCGFEETTDILPLGHDYELVEEQPASREEEGFKLYQCKNNVEHTYMQKLEPVGHSLSRMEVLVAPTCEEPGVRRGYCQNCNYYMEEEILPTGHHYEVSSEIKPSCLNSGKRVYVCTNDTSHQYEMVIPALDHDFGDSYPSKVPTCTEGGSYAHTCKRCSYEEVVAELIPTGHSFGYYTTIKEANCYESGTRERICEVCHYKETEIVPPTHHYSEEWTIDRKPTCLNEGEKSHHCLKCDAKVDITIISAIGHQLGEWTVDREPTCINDGEKSHYCLRCNAREDITKISALGHRFGDWKIITEATEESTGLKERECDKCSYKASEVIPKLQHIHTYNIINYNQTKHWMECRCGDTSTEEIHTFVDDCCTICKIDYDTSILLFSLNDDFSSYSVNGVSSTDKSDIIIPSEYKQLPVTSIGEFAFSNNRYITSIVIPNSVTRIGFSAFKNCNQLSSLTIPFLGEKFDGSINKHFGYIFGASEFRYNSDYIPSSLKDVKITGGDSIESYCFMNCNSLTSITIPNSVESIGNDAFNGCSKLATIEIPNSVKNIGMDAFNECAMLTSVYYGGAIEDWCNIVFILNTKFTNPKYKVSSNPMSEAEYFYMKNSNDEWKLVKNIEIPNTIKEIREYQFYSFDYVTSLTIPNSVNSIGYSAFMNCNSLKSINLPFVGTNQEDLQHAYLGYIFGAESYSENSKYVPYRLELTINAGENIANYAFYGLTFKIINLPDSVTSIGNAAFRDCSITSITIPDSVTSIGNEAFRDCSITSITIPDSVISIGNEAFRDCSITSITIPNSVTSIGNAAFLCYRLTSIYYEGTLEDWSNIIFKTKDSNPMYNASQLYMRNRSNEWEEVISIEIPNTITEIGAYQFYRFENLTSITIPNSVTSIGVSAFANCSSLTTITISESVTSIGEYAFSNCNSLRCAIVGNNVTTIENHAFDYCVNLTNIVLGEKVKNIGIDAFRDCYRLVEIYNLSSLDITAGSSLNEYAKVIHTSLEEDSSLIIIDDYLFIREENSYYLVQFLGTKTDLVLPNDIEGNSYGINSYAFYMCNNITSIVIPNSVTSIGKYAFNRCYNLESITIPNSVTSIGKYAFNRCDNLESITIPNSVTSIGDSAFEFCDLLTNVYYDGTMDGWCKIKYAYPFSNPMYYASHFYLRNSNNEWEEVTSIEIPNTITEIGAYQFFGFENVISITIPNSVTRIGYEAFRYCSNLTNIIITGNLTSIDRSAFDACDKLKYNEYDNGYYLGDGKEPYIFLWKAKSTSITDCEINSNTKAIGEYAFSNCNSLTSIVVPDSVTSIGNSAFENCGNLTNVVIGNAVTNIGSSAFKCCSNLRSMNIPNSIRRIEDYVFYGCNNLTSATIPESVTSIGKYAFSGCSSLTSINIPNSVTSIGDCAFANCTNLTSIVIPKSVTSIDQDAFGYSTDSMNIYYEGTFDEWNNIHDWLGALASLKYYFYSESRPVDVASSWHYVDGVPTRW